MGYSCTAKAHFTMDGIDSCLDKINANKFKHNNNEYFYEIGKENSNGAITGTIWKIDGDYCKRVGSFRINRDGKIIRFPYLSKRKKIYAELYGKYLYEKNYHF